MLVQGMIRMATSPKEDVEIEIDECVCISKFVDEIQILEMEVTDDDIKKITTPLLKDLEKYNLIEFFTVILSKEEREKMRRGEI